MWKVYEHRTGATKVLDKAPPQVKRKYTYWKQLVELDGPDALQRLPGFRDHALRGTWKGHRSSYLSKQYRVIYKAYGRALQIYVVKIGPHNY